MTGRRLYDRYVDATAKNFYVHRGSHGVRATNPLAAWPSLSNYDRSRWNDLARSITPKPKARS